jgi:hypothetical protein
MSFLFLNPWMLLGLSGIALPFVVHLLSRRRFEVVHWGAMQFLDLHKRTRQKLKLEQLLLMLVRMLMILLIVFAFSRAWGKGGLLTQMIQSDQRDVMIILDSSSSMARETNSQTPYHLAQDKIYELLEKLPSSYRIGLIDARDIPVSLLEQPVYDRAKVRQLVSELPPPTGTTHLPAAIEMALDILNKSTSLKRDIIILTDGQKNGWDLDQSIMWRQMDDMLQQLTVVPRIWTYVVAETDKLAEPNLYVSDLRLSRETAVPGFPIKITAIIKSFGQWPEDTIRNLHLEINQQRLGEKTTPVRVNSNGEMSIEFEQRLDDIQDALIRVVLDHDKYPADDSMEKVVVVKAGLPVLIVDGDPQPDPSKAESFFLKTAFAATHETSPWVRAEIVTLDELSHLSLSSYQAIILANIPDVPIAIKQELVQAIAGGVNVIIAPGDLSKTTLTQGWMNESQQNLIPAYFQNIVDRSKLEQQNLETPDSQSLLLPWQQKFTDHAGGDLTTSRIKKYWRVELSKLLASPLPSETGFDKKAPISHSEPHVIARLKDGAPWIVTRKVGLGELAVLSTPLDADWTTLPSKNDFLPFIHELIFSMTDWKSGRNVRVGLPLIVNKLIDVRPTDWKVTDPFGRDWKAQMDLERSRQILSFPATTSPGIYRFNQVSTMKSQPGINLGGYAFAVQGSREESVMTSLTADDVKTLVGEKERMSWLSNWEELAKAWRSDGTGTELWQLLLIGFLGLLILEATMTRRMSQGGLEYQTTKPNLPKSPEVAPEDDVLDLADEQYLTKN